MHIYENKKIYVIFSSTPLKIGKFIRIVTRNKYNHVSISLDPTFQSMYSFARYYKRIPLYGGFVKESSLRYRNKNKYATIKVCELDISYDKYVFIKNYLQQLENSSNEYLYNIFSAIFTPLKKKVSIYKSFTCIEFVIDTLSKIDTGIDSNKFYSIHDLEKYLQDKVVYEDLIEIKYEDSKYAYDHFMEKKSPFSNFYYTFNSIFNLSYRLISKTH